MTASKGLEAGIIYCPYIFISNIEIIQSKEDFERKALAINRERKIDYYLYDREYVECKPEDIEGYENAFDPKMLLKSRYQVATISNNWQKINIKNGK